MSFFPNVSESNHKFSSRIKEKIVSKIELALVSTKHIVGKYSMLTLEKLDI